MDHSRFGYKFLPGFTISCQRHETVPEMIFACAEHEFALVRSIVYLMRQCKPGPYLAQPRVNAHQIMIRELSSREKHATIGPLCGTRSCERLLLVGHDMTCQLFIVVHPNFQVLSSERCAMFAGNCSTSKMWTERPFRSSSMRWRPAHRSLLFFAFTHGHNYQFWGD